MNTKEAQAIVHDTITTYDAISHHFSQTRNNAGPWLQQLTKNVFTHATVLDVGCGNGRLVEVLPKKVDYTGIDVSENLITEARKKYKAHALDFATFDGAHLPFPDATFSHVFMLATLHHVPGKFQKILLNECKRVLRPGGHITVTVWHLWRKPFFGHFLKSLPSKLGKSSLDLFDIYIPWKDKNGKIQGRRYFHMFKKQELFRLLHDVAFKDISVTLLPLVKQQNYLATAKV